MKKVFSLMLLFILGIAIGGSVWWFWRQPRSLSSNNVILENSISLDESLAPAQSAESIATDSQDEALIARVIELPGVGLEKLPVEHFQPLFLRSACYLSAVDTCLVSIYEHEIANRHIVRQGQQPQGKFLDKPEMAFSMGRILGESDKVREFFVKEFGTLEAYFAFVRFIRTVSLENHINPALVYSLYDYLLLTAQGSGQPLTTLPNPQQLADQVNTSLSAYKRGEEPGDTISRQFAALESWSAVKIAPDYNSTVFTARGAWPRFHRRNPIPITRMKKTKKARLLKFQFGSFTGGHYIQLVFAQI